MKNYFVTITSNRSYDGFKVFSILEDNMVQAIIKALAHIREHYGISSEDLFIQDSGNIVTMQDVKGQTFFASILIDIKNT